MAAAEGDSGIEKLIAEFYEAFDNREGRALNAIALRNMFIPEAIIVRVQEDSVNAMTLGSFLDSRIQMLTNRTLEHFHEWETSAATSILGNMASRHSTYRKSGVLHGDLYEGGGRKFIQLVRISEAWRIASILWEDI